MNLDLPVVAGVLSTMLFALGTLPMLVKAATTKDLSSYSFGNIALSNVANVIHSVYIFALPPGPVWALHAFHLVSTGLMLVWYVRYCSVRTRRRAQVGRRTGKEPHRSAAADVRSAALHTTTHHCPAGALHHLPDAATSDRS